MREFAFWIRRTHGSRPERVTVQAIDEVQAVNSLPSCVSWDFCTADPE